MYNKIQQNQCKITILIIEKRKICLKQLIWQSNSSKLKIKRKTNGYSKHLVHDAKSVTHQSDSDAKYSSTQLSGQTANCLVTVTILHQK